LFFEAAPIPRSPEVAGAEAAEKDKMVKLPGLGIFKSLNEDKTGQSHGPGTAEAPGGAGAFAKPPHENIFGRFCWVTSAPGVPPGFSPTRTHPGGSPSAPGQENPPALPSKPSKIKPVKQKVFLRASAIRNDGFLV